MSSAKLLFTLCLTIMAVMGYPQISPLTVNDLETNLELESELRNIIDDLIHLMESLELAAQDAVNKALDTISGLLTDAENIAKSVVEGFGQELLNAAKTLTDEIFKLEQKAKNLGVDISDCIGDSNKEINYIYQQFLKNATTCVTQKVNQAEDLIHDSIDEVTGTLDKIHSLWKQVNECKNKNIFQQAICVASLTTKISLALTEIPLEIGKSVAKATQYIATLKADLLLCEAGKAVEFTKEGAAIVTKVTKCAKAKFNNATTTANPTKSSSITTEGPSSTTVASSTDLSSMKSSSAKTPSTEYSSTESSSTVVSTTTDSHSSASVQQLYKSKHIN